MCTVLFFVTFFTLIYPEVCSTYCLVRGWRWMNQSQCAAVTLCGGVWSPDSRQYGVQVRSLPRRV